MAMKTEKISKAVQVQLLTQLGVTRTPRIKLAQELDMSEYTLRKALDWDTPVIVSKQTAQKLNDWLNKQLSN